MTKRESRGKSKVKEEMPALRAIAVRGFKSIRDERRIEIRPLTILAGANSSGKSSIVQPLLLLKQTLESPADPGALLLDGPCARFTSVDQILNHGSGRESARSFSIRLELMNGDSLETSYRKVPRKGFDVEFMTQRLNEGAFTIRPEMSQEEIVRVFPEYSELQLPRPLNVLDINIRVSRNRCFLAFGLYDSQGKQHPEFVLSRTTGLELPLRSLIHLPGLRGNPEREYRRLAAGPRFPGTFENYAASVVARWQAEDKNKLDALGEAMNALGLTWKVSARAVDDTRVELSVGRLPQPRRGGAKDFVNIADVGFGVSQSLPVLVALIEATSGQLVYLEQPEIHLHPKAQRKLAHVLCGAAKRGVRLLIETHSALLLREVQTLVAMGDMPKEDVALHWFTRDETGATTVATAELDETGAYGDWPEDFDDTELEAESAYLDAVEAKQIVR